MEITFDPVKNRKNINRHGIDLTDAEPVFYDPHALTTEDRDHPEERFVTMGMDSRGRILIVVYHYRDEDHIRLISARQAEPHERRNYRR